MRAVIQRVKNASVTVDGETVSSIGSGLLILCGISKNDTEKDKEYIANKILNLRLWNNEETGKPWDLNVMQKNYEIILVSQFTLYAVMKGNRPDFHHSMRAEKSLEFYNSFVDIVKKKYKPNMIQLGSFGNYMNVNLCGDGPVTIELESPSPSK